MKTELRFEGKPTMAEVERVYLIKCLEEEGSIQRAANRMDVTAKTIYNKLNKYGIRHEVLRKIKVGV